MGCVGGKGGVAGLSSWESNGSPPERPPKVFGSWLTRQPSPRVPAWPARSLQSAECQLLPTPPHPRGLAHWPSCSLAERSPADRGDPAGFLPSHRHLWTCPGTLLVCTQQARGSKKGALEGLICPGTLRSPNKQAKCLSRVSGRSGPTCRASGAPGWTLIIQTVPWVWSPQGPPGCLGQLGAGRGAGGRAWAASNDVAINPV